MSLRTAVAIVFSTATFLAPADAQTIRYVDDDGDPSNPCTSWADACPELQTALSLAADGDQIWVASGTYTPDYDIDSGKHTGDRTATFQLISGVPIYGGFDGGEKTLEERAELFDDTILSGDLKGNDGPGFENNDDNSYHVVTSSGDALSPALDGFTITGGNANGSPPHNQGGGMTSPGSSPSVRNCSFVGNWAVYGGAVHNVNGSPTLSDCYFLSNAASNLGGGFDSHTANPAFVNCVFAGNTAYDGGAVQSDFSNITLTNCTITGNNASNRGGGVYLYTAVNMTMTNCNLWANTSDTGSGEVAQLYVTEGGNTAAINHSCIEGWTGQFGGDGNHGDDPLFFNPDNDDYHLSPGSPCIDAADNSPVPANSSDLDDKPRFVDDPLTPDCQQAPGQCGDCPVVDMGAYEFQDGAIECCPADLDGDGDVDAADLAELLSSWGPCIGCSADFDDDGDVDAADLAELLAAWGLCS